MGAYTLQIGAYKNRIDADVARKAYQAKYAALLLRYSSNVQRVDLGDKGTWYRLRISGFGNHEAASALCDQLKSQGDDCFFPNSGMVTAISSHRLVAEAQPANYVVVPNHVDILLFLVDRTSWACGQSRVSLQTEEKLTIACFPDALGKAIVPLRGLDQPAVW
jgi:hypothetical protein